MFTGIITDLGTVLSAEKKDGMKAKIATAFAAESFELGASIACNGVCLTVTDKGTDNDQHWFTVDISNETLDCTNLNNWQEESRINLERSLCLGDEMGGHMVSGHVDGLATLETKVPDGECFKLTFTAPEALAPFIAQKGSVALNGVSLTVNAVEGNQFSIMIIPHTMEKTTFQFTEVGDTLNLEIDQIARYVQRIMECQR